MNAHVTWLDGSTETFRFNGGNRIQRLRVDMKNWYTDSALFVRQDGDTLYFVQEDEPKVESADVVESMALRRTVEFLFR